jgi:hypothetical protein
VLARRNAEIQSVCRPGADLAPSAEVARPCVSMAGDADR